MAARRPVEDRAARYQRRYSGPWRTAAHDLGPVVVTYRYRRRLRSEWAELAVAGHDLWTHVIGRGLILPIVRRLARVLS